MVPVGRMESVPEHVSSVPGPGRQAEPTYPHRAGARLGHCHRHGARQRSFDYAAEVEGCRCSVARCGYSNPDMAVAVIVPEEEEYAALVRHAAENDLLVVDLQHLVRALRHDVANAEAAAKIAQETTAQLRAERRQGIADLRELLERFERR